MGTVNRDLLVEHELYATGTTGNFIEDALGTEVVKLQSGPLGGDQQIGAKIARVRLILSSFFGILWNRSPTIRTLKRS